MLWICIDSDLLDPDAFWEAGAGSRSKEIYKNLKINLIFNLSKRLLYLRRQCCGSADPDPTVTLMNIRILLPNKKLKTLKKCSKRLVFHTFCLVICKLMRIRIRNQLITLMRMRIQPLMLQNVLSSHKRTRNIFQGKIMK